jgi:hypothetical protein
MSISVLSMFYKRSKVIRAAAAKRKVQRYESQDDRLNFKAMNMV